MHVEFMAFKVVVVEIKCKGCGIWLTITSLLSCIPYIYHITTTKEIKTSNIQSVHTMDTPTKEIKEITTYSRVLQQKK
jgi:hypothetical protein